MGSLKKRYKVNLVTPAEWKPVKNNNKMLSHFKIFYMRQKLFRLKWGFKGHTEHKGHREHTQPRVSHGTAEDSGQMAGMAGSLVGANQGRK